MPEGLSIIIVNYFSEKYIQSLVSQILETIQIKQYEIIIVNNSPSLFSWSDDFLLEYNILLLSYQKNDGFGRAVNRGVKSAKYNCFCILNPDIELEKQTLNETYRFLLKCNSEVGAVSCLIKNRDGTRQNSFFMDKQRVKKDFTLNLIREFLPARIRKYIFKEKELYKDNFSISLKKPFEVGGFYGSFVMFKKECFTDVGGFDPDFFMYSEDTDLFRNRFSKKYKSYFYPFVSLTHYVGGTDDSGLMHKQAQVSFLLNLRKTGSYFLFIYVFILGSKYTLLLLHSLFKKRDDTHEAKEFFSNLKYLPYMLKYPRGYHTLPRPLVISELKKKKKINNV